MAGGSGYIEVTAIEVMPTQSLIEDLCALATRMQIGVKTSVNSVQILVWPHDRPEQIRDSYLKAVERGTGFASANLSPGSDPEPTKPVPMDKLKARAIDTIKALLKGRRSGLELVEASVGDLTIILAILQDGRFAIPVQRREWLLAVDDAMALGDGYVRVKRDMTFERVDPSTLSFNGAMPKVKIKDLVWEPAFGATQTAKCVLGTYTVWPGYYRPPNSSLGIPVGSNLIDIAKREAQDHFMMQIASVIEMLEGV